MRAFTFTCVLLQLLVPIEGFVSALRFARPLRTSESWSAALAAASSPDSTADNGDLSLSDVGFVLLAGGTGSRMKANMPKQFLKLQSMTVLEHSLKLLLETLPGPQFNKLPAKVVLVMNEQYR